MTIANSRGRDFRCFTLRALRIQTVKTAPPPVQFPFCKENNVICRYLHKLFRSVSGDSDSSFFSLTACLSHKPDRMGLRHTRLSAAGQQVWEITNHDDGSRFWSSVAGIARCTHHCHAVQSNSRGWGNYAWFPIGSGKTSTYIPIWLEQNSTSSNCVFSKRAYVHNMYAERT